MGEGQRPLENMERLIDMQETFGSIFKGKKVLVTGHSGFKGSWLSTWLIELGAEVVGYSLYEPSKPSNFRVLNLRDRLNDIKGDICDYKHLKKLFDDFSPEVVFHLAAQAITCLSYDIPHDTFYTNVGGTINIFECIRESKSVKAAVIITSDKCYLNSEWTWGYRESDRLGGKDPYSASKACAELVSYSYNKSFFSGNKSPGISTARAGNVIGGGDWARDRVIPDCVKALNSGKKLIIRNPQATRPWQHVLEPLSGYLWLGACLLKNKKNVRGESFNFGPADKVTQSVKELIGEFLKIWGKGTWKHIPVKNQKSESASLKLCCDKALHELSWHSLLTFQEAVALAAEWYKNYYYNKNNMYDFTCSQIKYYIKKAITQNMPWVNKV